MTGGFAWKTVDDTTMHGYRWEAPEKARGLVCLVHGFGEYCERYHHVAAALNKSGWDVAGFDHRGHGRSEGQRGCIPYPDAMLDDIQLFLNQQAADYDSDSVVLYGHSMGGALVLYYLTALVGAELPAAAVVTSPGLVLPGLNTQRSRWQELILKVMLRLRPHSVIQTRLPVSKLSRDPEVVEAYREDSLVHGQMSLLLADSFARWAAEALEKAERLPVQTLIMHGTEDAICLPEGSEAFAAKASYAELRLWPEGYHELHNDIEGDTVLTTVTEWLKETVES